MIKTISNFAHNLGEYNKFVVAQLGAVGVLAGSLLGLNGILPAGIAATATAFAAEVAAVGVLLAANQDAIDKAGDELANFIDR